MNLTISHERFPQKEKIPLSINEYISSWCGVAWEYCIYTEEVSFCFLHVVGVGWWINVLGEGIQVGRSFLIYIEKISEKFIIR